MCACLFTCLFAYLTNFFTCARKAFGSFDVQFLILVYNIFADSYVIAKKCIVVFAVASSKENSVSSRGSYKS